MSRAREQRLSYDNNDTRKNTMSRSGITTKKHPSIKIVLATCNSFVQCISLPFDSNETKELVPNLEYSSLET